MTASNDEGHRRAKPVHMAAKINANGDVSAEDEDPALDDGENGEA